MSIIRKPFSYKDEDLKYAFISFVTHACHIPFFNMEPQTEIIFLKKMLKVGMKIDILKKSINLKFELHI